MVREYLSIVRRNVFTPIVLAIGVLAVGLMLMGEYRDAWFISVVVTINSLIGIVQEVRAHHALRKLEILNAPRARRLTDSGEYEVIMATHVEVGDVLRVESGDQIPADAKVLKSQGLECDESLLTGEACTIAKSKGETIYAGSVALAGAAEVKVLAVGVESKAGAMTATLKRYKPELTPLQKTISRAIQFLTYSALAISVLIIIVYTIRNIDAVTILKTITTAGVVVVPEGLLLASTLLLAFGAINLARNKVLPQKLGAIEAMALLNVLCVDKTGTLTSDTMKLESVEAIGSHKKDELQQAIYTLAHETSAGNVTGKAILAGLSTDKATEVTDILAFSSQRKMSAVRFSSGEVIAMGAPEILGRHASISSTHQQRIDEYTARGHRVLLVAYFDYDGPLKSLPQHAKAKASGLVILSNELRHGVVHTVKYLQGQDVSMRVISGDNPKTVQYVAESAGITNTEAIMTGAELSKLKDSEWDKKVLETTIFARVLPEQKQRIIETFRKDGHFTGMVGDGVNDALALKEADLGVAMFAGAPASRRIADIILLNNSFTSMPIGMKLGNKIMLAIELIATLFFHKIIYGVILLFITLAINELYPFMPRHITFMNIFLVTMPTILWTLFPPNTTKRINPRLFWKRTLWRIAPIALLSGSAVAFTYWWFLQSIPAGSEAGMMAVSTSTVITATIVGMMIVFLVPRLFHARHNKAVTYMRVLYVIGALGVAGGAFGITFAREFFDFVLPAWEHAWVPALVIIGTFVAQRKIVFRLRDKFDS